MTFTEYVAGVLHARADELAAHWRQRASAATPRRTTGDAADGGHPAPDSALALVRALAASLHKDARWPGEVMRAGWRIGTEGHAAGLSVHHVLKDADLLLAVLLAAVEQGIGADAPPAGAADAFAVARRLHRAAAFAGQAAAAAFLHAFLDALRARYRLLRHDLRNPLGTIRSALSLMEDETVPLETRHGPGIRAMVARNAGSLDRLIALGLDDAAAAALLAPTHEVPVREVACAVRRTVREPARLAGCEIEVDVPADCTARVDESALELVLTALVLAAVATARDGDVLRVSLPPVAATSGDGDGAPLSLHVALACRRAPAPHDGDGSGEPPVFDPRGVALADSLAAQYGGRLVPVSRGPQEAAYALVLPSIAGSEPPVRVPRTAARIPQPAASAHSRDDLPRAD